MKSTQHIRTIFRVERSRLLGVGTTVVRPVRRIVTVYASR